VHAVLFKPFLLSSINCILVQIPAMGHGIVCHETNLTFAKMTLGESFKLRFP